MNTVVGVDTRVYGICSDSSMVDEYPFQGDNAVRCVCSDSSMVDEYMAEGTAVAAGAVQIPLWSMNTTKTTLLSVLSAMFRFLYGR